MFLVMLTHSIAIRNYPTIETFDWGLDDLFTLSLDSVSFVCVNCFILISGYFGIRWKYKSISNLLFQILFWLIVGYVMALLLNLDTANNFLGKLIHYGQGRWFISAYLMVYLLSPLTNSFAEHNSTRNLGYYLVVFYLASTIYGYCLGAKEFNTGLSAISLLGIYITGLWLRRTDNPLTKFSAKTNLLIYLGISMIMVILNSSLLSLGIGKSLFGYLNPAILIASVYLFLFFKGLNIGSIKWINFLSASAFAIFLFHCNPFTAELVSDTWRYLYVNFEYSFPLILLSFVAIYLFCVAIDRIRITIFDTAWVLLFQRKPSIETVR